MPLFIHPQTPAPSVRAAQYAGIGERADLALAAFGLGWHYEAGLEWIRLAAAGVFDALQELQIILGHWGEVVLFYLERTSAVMDRALDLDRSLIEYARCNLYVTGSGMWSATYLQQCLDIVGPERRCSRPTSHISIARVVNRDVFWKHWLAMRRRAVGSHSQTGNA
ncbi:hypothetical protein ACQR50_07090 [Sphingomonas sp. Xoc002]|uniref:hypothetical protein n=1 Tax=Sphingomonas sp. Xoc002 TaxID=2837624 RepID=UPI003D17D570